MPPHQGRRHRTGGDHERLSLESAHDEREDERDDDGLDGIAVALGRWGSRLYRRWLWGNLQSGGRPSHRLVYPLVGLTKEPEVRLPLIDFNSCRAQPPESRTSARQPGLLACLVSLAYLANVTNSARIGNPAYRTPEDLQRHQLAGQMHQKRLSDEHRPAHHRPFAPEPRVVRDRAVVAQHKELVVSQLHVRARTMSLPRGVGQHARIVDVAIDPDLVDLGRVNTAFATLPGCFGGPLVGGFLGGGCFAMAPEIGRAHV